MWLQTTVLGVQISPHPQPTKEGNTFTYRSHKIMIRLVLNSLKSPPPAWLDRMTPRGLATSTSWSLGMKEMLITTTMFNCNFTYPFCSPLEFDRPLGLAPLCNWPARRAFFLKRFHFPQVLVYWLIFIACAIISRVIVSTELRLTTLNAWGFN